MEIPNRNCSHYLWEHYFHHLQENTLTWSYERFGGCCHSFIYFVFFSFNIYSNIHSVHSSISIHRGLSPFLPCLLLRGKNLPGLQSQDSNSGLPHSAIPTDLRCTLILPLHVLKSNGIHLLVEKMSQARPHV
jgi:hypothetical protein